MFLNLNLEFHHHRLCSFEWQHLSQIGMFKADENANELFRRLNLQSFDFKVDRNTVEKLKFGDLIEVQAVPGDISEVTHIPCIDI